MGSGRAKPVQRHDGIPGPGHAIIRTASCAGVMVLLFILFWGFHPNQTETLHTVKTQSTTTMTMTGMTKTEIKLEHRLGCLFRCLCQCHCNASSSDEMLSMMRLSAGRSILLACVVS